MNMSRSQRRSLTSRASNVPAEVLLRVEDHGSGLYHGDPHFGLVFHSMIRCGFRDRTSDAIVAVNCRPIIEYNVSMKILFLHCWHSDPGGVKPTFLAQHGHKVVNPKLPDEHFEEAVKVAQEEFDKHQPQVVVGSSRGGAVAMNINSGDAKVVLLCPAWKKWGRRRR